MKLYQTTKKIIIQGSNSAALNEALSNVLENQIVPEEEHDKSNEHNEPYQAEPLDEQVTAAGLRSCDCILMPNLKTDILSIHPVFI